MIGVLSTLPLPGTTLSAWARCRCGWETSIRAAGTGGIWLGEDVMTKRRLRLGPPIAHRFWRVPCDWCGLTAVVWPIGGRGAPTRR